MLNDEHYLTVFNWPSLMTDLQVQTVFMRQYKCSSYVEYGDDVRVSFHKPQSIKIHNTCEVNVSQRLCLLQVIIAGVFEC